VFLKIVLKYIESDLKKGTKLAVDDFMFYENREQQLPASDSPFILLFVLHLYKRFAKREKMLEFN
jgi:hypothetical protein